MRSLPMTVTRVADVSVLRPVGPLDIATTPRLRIALEALLGGAQRHLVVDMSGVEYLDPAAIGALIAARNRAESAGGSLRVAAARPIVQEVLRLTGTDEALGAAAPLDATVHPAPSRPARGDRGQETAELLLRVMWTLPAGAPERSALRAAAIEAAVPFAAALAHRYRDRGEPTDDLAQVAALGLVKAVDRYNPGRGDFVPFAAPTILGEVRRHFRDNAWQLHVPRRVQDLRVRAVRAQAVLAQRLGRSPSADELATHLSVPVADVLAAFASGKAYAPRSLSVRPGIKAHADRLAEPDLGIEAVVLRATVGPAMARLPERERRILVLRFAENLTQAQIGERLGVSQMQVSRQLRQALEHLRAALD